MSLLGVCQWLASTRPSIALHESIYGYPITESVHVWTLCLFVGLAVVTDLRLLGVTFRRIPTADLVRRLEPWMTAGFVVMVLSGALLFYAIPVRSYQNIFFRAKVVLLALAGLNVWVFHSRVYSRIAEWGTDAVPPRAARTAGACSLTVWLLIVLCGRLIAYDWFDCNKRPVTAAINVLEGCTAGDSRH
jgi:hypothetical protein